MPDDVAPQPTPVTPVAAPVPVKTDNAVVRFLKNYWPAVVAVVAVVIAAVWVVS